MSRNFRDQQNMLLGFNNFLGVTILDKSYNFNDFKSPVSLNSAKRLEMYLKKDDNLTGNF